MYEAGSIISLFIVAFGVISLMFCNNAERKDLKLKYHKSEKELKLQKDELRRKQTEYEDFMEHYRNLEVPLWPGHSVDEIEQFYDKKLPAHVPSIPPDQAYEEWKNPKILHLQGAK